MVEAVLQLVYVVRSCGQHHSSDHGSGNLAFAD